MQACQRSDVRLETGLGMLSMRCLCSHITGRRSKQVALVSNQVNRQAGVWLGGRHRASFSACAGCNGCRAARPGLQPASRPGAAGQL